MTLFVNLRAGGWGAVCQPYLLRGEADADKPAMTSVDWNAVPLLARGKSVLLAAHGFNVSYLQGLRCLGRLEAALRMREDELFLGVLWPGDWTIPAVNYPFEDRIASHAGRLIADFCNRWLATADSLSFLSHSLGARVVLEAIAGCARTVHGACITAGAVNSACLAEEYAAAARNCRQIRTLASRKDLVLSLAYPPGDAVADLLDPDHPPFEPALGRGGPRAPWGASVLPSQIGPAPPYDHGDYLPSGEAGAAPPGPADKWRRTVEFMAAAYRGETPSWP